MTKLTTRRGATVRDVRRANRSVLLRRLFFDGPVSRQELVADTGLSSGTVTNVIATLIAQGLVIEAGREDSDGGRPRVLLQVARERGVVIGVEVGETHLRVEVFDLRLEKIAAADRAVGDGDRSPQWVVDSIATAIGETLAAIPVDEPAVLGIGVGVSGIVDQGLSPLVHAPTLGWEDVPLAAMLRSRLDLPVIVDNGAKALGQAEMWFGAGRGVRHAAVALLGTGVGAAIFTDGQLYRGAHSSAGEWGHTPIMVAGRECRCGSRGCLESYVGGLALAERWAAARGGAPWNAGDQEAAVQDLVASLETDPRAAEFIAHVSEELGAGLATIVNLFNPERIVLAGWVGLQLGPFILDAVTARARAYALRQPFEQVEIVLGQVGPDAVALGAATLVVDSILAGELPISVKRSAAEAASSRPSGRVTAAARS